MKIGYCCGVFDLGHVGHIKFLKRAKEKCDFLYIGLVSDEAVRKQKGEDRPIFNFKERYSFVEALGFRFHQIYKQPTFDPSEYLKYLKPDIFIKGEDQFHISDIMANKMNIPIIIIPRTPDVSTSEIIERIKK